MPSSGRRNNEGGYHRTARGLVDKPVWLKRMGNSVEEAKRTGPALIKKIRGGWKEKA
jgi:hypothetical protein